MIEVTHLIAVGVSPNIAKAFLPHVRQACGEFAITTPERIAAFLAQASHESAGFAKLEESLYYSTPERIRQVWPKQVQSMAQAQSLAKSPKALALAVYSSRMGNGSAESGDGWTYRGRGLFQLTGRANYEAAAIALGQPYVQRPELVALPEHACMTAAHYWHERRLNGLADAKDMAAITRSINGPGMLGAKERIELFEQAMEAFNA